MVMKSNTTGVLYLVATPIGNFSDVSERMIATLSEVDILLCERPMHSKRLLQHIGVVPPKVAKLTDHDAPKVLLTWLEALKNGQSIAYVSDAGTPLISDPGAALVELAHQHCIKVVPIPGPSAVSTVMSMTGLSTNGYQFYGFLPSKSSARVKVLAGVVNSQHAVVFFESPHRLIASLSDMQTVLGDNREVFVAKELTKIYESYWRGSLADVLNALRDASIKGEYVVVLAPFEGDAVDTISLELERVMRILHDDQLPMAQAVGLAVQLVKVSKNQAYGCALHVYQKL